MNIWNFLLTALILTGFIIWSLILTAQTSTIIDELTNLPIPAPFINPADDSDSDDEGDKGQKGQKGQKGSCDCSGSCRKVCCYQTPQPCKGQKADPCHNPCQKGAKGEPGPKGAPGQSPPQAPPVPGPKGSEGPEGDKGTKGEKGEPDGDKGEKGSDGAKGETGQKGDAGGQKGEKGETGADGPKGEPDGDKGEKGEAGQKGEEGNKGEIGFTGQKGEKGATNLAELRMFNWGHANDEGTLNNNEWDGTNTVAGNKQTHHIFDLGTGTYRVTSVMMVDMNQPDQHLYVDEILPANFNSSSITNPMDIKFISVTGENKVTVAQGTGGDADKKITFTSSTDDEVIKVIFEVTATEPTCAFWYYRASSNNNKLHLYQVIIETL